MYVKLQPIFIILTFEINNNAWLYFLSIQNFCCPYDQLYLKKDLFSQLAQKESPPTRFDQPASLLLYHSQQLC